MITEETPLPEVIAFFPRDLAKFLGEKTPEVQQATVEMMRSIMAAWDERGLDFDPVTYEALLFDVGIHVMAMLSSFERAINDLT